jgi:methionyl-tRNA synthetase
VRFLTGTDDNALKNVTAARAAGVPVREFVARNAARFAASTGARTRAGTAPAANGSWPTERATRTPYGGFWRRDGSASSRRRGATTCWRLSGARWPTFSVSRPAARAGGWGIPVPGGPGQVIYVWWDALANYLTADPAAWAAANDRAHVIGKGIVRFMPCTGSPCCCAGFDLRAATGALTAAVDTVNRYIEAERPWERPDGRDDVLATLVRACRIIAGELTPFLPTRADRLCTQLGRVVGHPRPAFPRLGG